jgi:methanogenic corrinoid protein MtbC1
VDATVEKFIRGVEELKADIVGASALMSTTVPQQRKIVEALKRAGLRNKVKFIIGGAAVSENWAKQIGADAYALAAGEAVQKARDLLEH